jgi:hypothetical protein
LALIGAQWGLQGPEVPAGPNVYISWP